MKKPLFKKESFAKRREKIFQKLRDRQDLVLLFTTPEFLRNNDNGYPFRPDSNFYYLTGFEEPASACLLWKEGKKKNFLLFLQERDPAMEQWTGKRLGTKAAKKALGCQAAYPINELAGFLQRWLENCPQGRKPMLHSNAFNHEKHFRFLTDFVSSFRPRPREKVFGFEGFLDSAEWLRQNRYIKTPEELKIIRESCKINVKAHLETLKDLKNFKNEWEVRASLEHHFLKNGSTGPAYSSICAAGSNAVCLHYNQNSAPLKKGELLLIDAGCEYQYYASDITRTYPIGGKFNPAQRKIMDAVGKAHKECIKKCRPGMKISELHKTAALILSEALARLKIIPSSTPKKIFASKSFRKYFPHGLGHHMGLDVHDFVSYFDDKGDEIPLKAGNIITIEPGLYFPEDDKNVPKEYRGIGVRIEDDILIKSNGSAENLTTGLPAYADEIEDFLS